MAVDSTDKFPYVHRISNGIILKICEKLCKLPTQKESVFDDKMPTLYRKLSKM